jgi:predicted ABC-class ATPase
MRYLKHQWDEEDAARDELELEARRKFLEQEANEIFTSMGTYFMSLAKALRAIGASVEIGEHWEHVRDQTLRRTTKLVSAG